MTKGKQKTKKNIQNYRSYTQALLESLFRCPGALGKFTSVTHRHYIVATAEHELHSFFLPCQNNVRSYFIHFCCYNPYSQSLRAALLPHIAALHLTASVTSHSTLHTVLSMYPSLINMAVCY